MKLVENYSLATGLKIGEPFVYEAPFPLPFDKYICICNGSGNGAKNFRFYQDVIDFVLPKLKELGINIVQLGMHDDIALDNCLGLQGKTSMHQTAFLIRNSLLFIGNDSLLSHIAGSFYKKLVTLFGPTSPKNHAAFWYDKDNTIFIESHRNGKLPSFSFNENPRTIDLINPAEVSKAVLRLLEIKDTDNIDTINVGSKYAIPILETVLDTIVPPEFLSQCPLNIRYDFLANPQALANQLSVRKCGLVTDVPIDLGLLTHFKDNILAIMYELKDNHNVEFARAIAKLGVTVQFFSSLDEERLRTMKLDYFDVGLINQENVITKESLPNYEKITNSTLFKSRKIILSRNKFYSSKTHWLLDTPRKSFNEMEDKIIDIAKFYEESDYFYYYNKN